MLGQYSDLSHAIENTANQKARNPLHILRYATGSIPRKNPGVPRSIHLMSSTYLYFSIFFIKIMYFQETLPIC